MSSFEKVIQAGGNLSIGTKQTVRSVELGMAVEVYVAKDADPRITSKIVDLCQKKKVRITYVDSMKSLGKACGIEVGAAMAARINE